VRFPKFARLSSPTVPSSRRDGRLHPHQHPASVVGGSAGGEAACDGDPSDGGAPTEALVVLDEELADSGLPGVGARRRA
jgi:hypothetical protein